jgi:hypothetical protein
LHLCAVEHSDMFLQSLFRGEWLRPCHCPVLQSRGLSYTPSLEYVRERTESLRNG